MVICPDCGKDVKEAKFCSNCGASLPEAQPPVEEEVEKIEENALEKVDNDIIEVNEEIDDEDVIEVNVKEENESNESKNSKFCPNCGTEIGMDVAFCPNCGFKFVQEETAQTKFCQSCGEKININAEICPHCGVRVGGVSLSGEKSALLAAILSFLFPGLGHLYLGLNKKGVSFIVAYIVSAILILLLIGIVLALIVWIWALVDSIKSTDALNRGEFVEDKLF